MSAHDKAKALENWQKGEIQVMVCTSAFGLGVNTPGMCEKIKLLLYIVYTHVHVHWVFILILLREH